MRPWDDHERKGHDPQPGEVVVRMLVAYDGSAYSGVAEQRQRPTVAGALADVMAPVLGARPRLAIAGRTDAGVHAYGQVFSAAMDARRARPERLVGAVGAGVSPTIALRAVEHAPQGFHARHSALARRYRYLVRSAPHVDPLRAATQWHVRAPISLDALRSTVEAVVGEHDFAAFCRRPPETQWRSAETGVTETHRGSTRRVVSEATWHELDDATLLFEIEASSFCQQMVRSLVGAMVDVGRARLSAARFRDHLRDPSMHCSATRAPAHGLALVGVRYPDGFGEPFVDPRRGPGGLPARWPDP